MQEICPTHTPMDSKDLARQVSRAVVTHLHQNGGGHFGGSLSVVDLLAVLLVQRPFRMGGGDMASDRLVLSKGHASLSLYALQKALGYHHHDLSDFGQAFSALQGHPDMKRMPCIDFSTGSLGQGVAIGLGMAMALQAEGGQVWVVLGDGECQEGMVWESAMLAARLGVCNLHVLVDANGQQECGWAHAPLLEQAPIPMDVQKWQAFGWQAESADGHDHNALARWVSLAQQQAIPARPRVLLARTQKALPACGDRMSTQRHHHTQLSDSEFRALLRHYEPTPSTCN